MWMAKIMFWLVGLFLGTAAFLATLGFWAIGNQVLLIGFAGIVVVAICWESSFETRILAPLARELCESGVVVFEEDSILPK